MRRMKAAGSADVRGARRAGKAGPERSGPPVVGGADTPRGGASQCTEDMDKNELRSRMRRLNRVLAPEERAAASERIAAAVERLEAFGRARTVALFCSLADEPDTAAVLRRWSAAKRLAVPRVEGETMRFYRYDPSTMRPGAFGIEEPGAGAVVCDPAEIDLMLVPGVAFAPDGRRLGRGRGYYDRYLARADVRAVRVGVCFAHQLTEEVPAEPHDVRMDRVIAG